MNRPQKIEFFSDILIKCKKMYSLSQEEFEVSKTLNTKQLTKQNLFFPLLC